MWGQTEICLHCGNENFYKNYDPEKSGYIVVCKACGKKIFLCDACIHNHNICTYYETKMGRGCHKGFIKEGD